MQSVDVAVVTGPGLSPLPLGEQCSLSRVDQTQTHIVRDRHCPCHLCDVAMWVWWMSEQARGREGRLRRGEEAWSGKHRQAQRQVRQAKSEQEQEQEQKQNHRQAALCMGECERHCITCLSVVCARVPLLQTRVTLAKLPGWGSSTVSLLPPFPFPCEALLRSAPTGTRIYRTGES